jgi:hypothetical protein
MSSQKGRTGTLFGTETTAIPETRSPDDEALLLELSQCLLEARPKEVIERNFSKLHPELHFRIRSSFGSYCSALAILLKEQLGRPLDGAQVLAALRDRFDAGESITLEGLLSSDPLMAQALVREFGSLPAALSELAIAPDVAAQDRRWERPRIFHSILELLGASIGDLSESLLDEKVPLLAAVVRREFGSFASFLREFTAWVEAQSAVFLLWGRQSLSRVLTHNLPETSRAAKGRNLADVQRIKLSCAAQPGYRLHLLTNFGLLYPLDSASVPFVAFGAGESEAAARLPALNRGEKPVAMVDLGDKAGYLALASSLGRVKLIALESIKRVRAQGTLVMKLAADDMLAAGAVVPPGFERLVVVTRNGRSVAFERPGIKLSSRSSMGVYRLRFDGEKGGEPVAVLGTTSDQDLVLLGKTGALLRLGREEVPSRKGASLGRRLWRTPVVGAVAVAESSRLLIATRRGRLLCFPAMQLPTRQALRKGVLGIRLDGDDAPETIGTA